MSPKKNFKPDFYDLLGVSENASQEEIQKAYKKMAKKYHPDGKSEKDKKAYNNRMAKINVAHDVLKDPDKRLMYDIDLREYRRKAAQSSQPGSSGTSTGASASRPSGKPSSSNSGQTRTQTGGSRQTTSAGSSSGSKQATSSSRQSSSGTKTGSNSTSQGQKQSPGSPGTSSQRPRQTYYRPKSPNSAPSPGPSSSGGYSATVPPQTPPSPPRQSSQSPQGIPWQPSGRKRRRGPVLAMILLLLVAYGLGRCTAGKSTASSASVASSQSVAVGSGQPKSQSQSTSPNTQSQTNQQTTPTNRLKTVSFVDLGVRYVTSNSYVNVYEVTDEVPSGPVFDIGEIKPSATIEIYEPTKPHIHGYTKDLIEIVKPQRGMVFYSYLEVNVYSRPSLDAQVVGQVMYYKGAYGADGLVEIVVGSEQNGWIEVNRPHKGWIYVGQNQTAGSSGKLVEKAVSDLGIKHVNTPRKDTIYSVDTPNGMLVPIREIKPSESIEIQNIVPYDPYSAGRFVLINKPIKGMMWLNSLYVNVYASPSKSTKVISQISCDIGQVTIVSGSEKNGWLQITQPEKGWIYTK